MSRTQSSPACNYYDAPATNRFYQIYWGGSDIHIGRYDEGARTIAEASETMSRYLLSRAGVRSGMQVLDIACGYGGTLRLLARMGCEASGLDISGACVGRARQLNASAGLGDTIDVTQGDFHSIPSEADTWDRVICQESIIHSINRPEVFGEVYRVLRPGGAFALSDIFVHENGDIGLVKSAFERLQVSCPAKASDYQFIARKTGFDIAFYEERQSDIVTHYDRLALLMDASESGNDPEMRTFRESIRIWQQALSGDHITWACMVAAKPMVPDPAKSDT